MTVKRSKPWKIENYLVQWHIIFRNPFLMMKVSRKKKLFEKKNQCKYLIKSSICTSRTKIAIITSSQSTVIVNTIQLQNVEKTISTTILFRVVKAIILTVK